MPTEPRPIVLSASDLIGTMPIDHGNTVARCSSKSEKAI
jgi:hypothetical protein